MRRFYGRPPGDAPGDGGQPGAATRCDGYLPGGELCGGDGERLSMAELPPFLRALLVTDGTVTKILEAYFWEPVAVETLEQRFERAEAPVPWVEARAGDSCLVRDARLRGQHSGRAYAEAFSLIRTEWVPADFRDRLIRREIGIGVLIRDSGLESYRELLDMGLDRGEEARPCVFRSYRIVIARRPVILITERFPLDLFGGT